MLIDCFVWKYKGVEVKKWVGVKPSKSNVASAECGLKTCTPCQERKITIKQKMQFSNIIIKS